MQPVSGRLIAARMRRLLEDMGPRADFTVVELGAGRGEMAPTIRLVARCAGGVGSALC
jgi:SAM-dependent MidA family methyltransferase